LLSDPHLALAGLGVAISRHHPMSKRYPEGAFLQPAVFLFERGELTFRWLQDPKLTNFYGSANRLSPEEILEVVRSRA